MSYVKFLLHFSRGSIMNKKYNKNKFPLAKRALLHFYHCKYLGNEEISGILNECCTLEDVCELEMQMMCEENNDVLVSAVLLDASDEEREFLREKYKKNKSFVSLGLKFHIHPSGLQQWRDKVLDEISQLMEFELPKEDIFSRNKIEALIYVLERLIYFYESYKLTNSDELDDAKHKLEIYNDLLFTIRQILNSDSNNIGYNVIRAKVLNRNVLINELEEIVGCSSTTIYHYIHLFQEQFYPK